MPKKVDHHERRLIIADALKRVASEMGLEQISLRHVASEAGLSAGTIQHYFRTKDEMMTFALAEVQQSTAGRLSAAVAALGENPSPHDLLRTTLTQMLALDDARRADGRVALAFLSYMAVRPDAATALRADARAMLTFVGGLIRTAQQAGQAAPGLDPDLAATGLLALADGLNNYLLSGHYGPERAVATLHAHLAMIFTG